MLPPGRSSAERRVCLQSTAEYARRVQKSGPIETVARLDPASVVEAPPAVCRVIVQEGGSRRTRAHRDRPGRRLGSLGRGSHLSGGAPSTVAGGELRNARSCWRWRHWWTRRVRAVGRCRRGPGRCFLRSKQRLAGGSCLRAARGVAAGRVSLVYQTRCGERCNEAAVQRDPALE